MSYVHDSIAENRKNIFIKPQVTPIDEGCEVPQGTARENNPRN
jgi:hypothetical protein